MKYKKFMMLFLYVVVALLTPVAKGSNNGYEREYSLLKTSGVKIADVVEEVTKAKSRIEYKKAIKFNNKKNMLVKARLNSKTLLVDRFSISIINGIDVPKIECENIKGMFYCKRLGKTKIIDEKVVPLSILPFWLHRKVVLNPDKISLNVKVLDEFNLVVLSCDIKLFMHEKNLYKILYKLGDMRFIETWNKKREISELKQGDTVLISKELQPEANMAYMRSMVKKIPIEDLASGLINIYFGARTLEVCLPEGIKIPDKDYQSIKRLTDNGSRVKYIVKIDYEYKRDNLNCFLRDKSLRSIACSKCSSIAALDEVLFRDVGSDIEKVCILFNWIKSNINLVDGSSPEPEVVFSKKKGDCEGVSNLFIAILNYENINAKPVWGILLTEEKGKLFGIAHQWVEIFIDNDWQSIDPTFGLTKLTNNYFELKEIENCEDDSDALKILNSITIKVRR